MRRPGQPGDERGRPVLRGLLQRVQQPRRGERGERDVRRGVPVQLREGAELHGGREHRVRLRRGVHIPQLRVQLHRVGQPPPDRGREQHQRRVRYEEHVFVPAVQRDWEHQRGPDVQECSQGRL